MPDQRATAWERSSPSVKRHRGDPNGFISRKLRPPRWGSLLFSPQTQGVALGSHEAAPLGRVLDFPDSPRRGGCRLPSSIRPDTKKTAKTWPSVSEAGPLGRVLPFSRQSLKRRFSPFVIDSPGHEKDGQHLAVFSKFGSPENLGSSFSGGRVGFGHFRGAFEEVEDLAAIQLFDGAFVHAEGNQTLFLLTLAAGSGGSGLFWTSQILVPFCGGTHGRSWFRCLKWK